MGVTIVVEDGTNVAGANSYLTEAEGTAALEGIGGEKQLCWKQATKDDRAQALVAATSYLQRHYRWYGVPANASQALAWPRTKTFDLHGDVIPQGTIPKQLKDAQILIAAEYLAAGKEGTESTIAAEGKVKSWSADGVSIGFDTAALMESQLSGKRFAEAEYLLRSIGDWLESGWLDKGIRIKGTAA